MWLGRYVYYTLPKEIDFQRYNLKCSGENVILRGIQYFMYFMLYRGNFDYFSGSVYVSWTFCYPDTMIEHLSDDAID